MSNPELKQSASCFEFRAISEDPGNRNSAGPGHVFVWLGLILSTVTLFGCGQGQSAEAEQQARARPAARVYIQEVVETSVVPRTIAVGTVVAKRTSEVASGADGKVDRLLVREGDVVEAGQELSILNMTTTNLGIEEAEKVAEIRKHEWEESKGPRAAELRRAESMMNAAKIEWDTAVKKYERLQQLYKSGAANEDDFDNAAEKARRTAELYTAAESAYRLIAEGERDEKQMQLKANYEAQVKQVEYLRAEKGKRTTIAPFDGVVVEEHTEDGEWLSKGDPVVKIAEILEEVFVIAQVDQRQIRNVQLGTEVAVDVQTPVKKDWVGTVSSIIPQSDWEMGSRTFPVKVAVPNMLIEQHGRSQPVLIEGMYARVTFQGPERTAVLVPKNAVIRSETGSRVVVAAPGEAPGSAVAKLVMIREGEQFGDQIEVLDGALTAGTTVVVEGAERLTPFQDLQIVDRNAPEEVAVSQQEAGSDSSSAE
ncbi:Efflux pump periplasmic linker BepF [Thalassoglobus neptunius]|uniref:Efflux pump periplasmic linker BepF n=1 Tax=Thalassoglobus neptunius TaxID=1938619 RepID=A0A5C5X6W5_9PLAN|nr:efflux RND transporter periplasmic adaptor subunit [Thalassoglobus neptunius]TWT58644.1 Efflux pump periplasmic linker BepF [Thalassoglobus neptunius]